MVWPLATAAAIFDAGDRRGFAAEVERSREVRIDRTGRNGRMQRAYFDGRGSEKESI